MRAQGKLHFACSSQYLVPGQVFLKLEGECPRESLTVSRQGASSFPPFPASALTGSGGRGPMCASQAEDTFSRVNRTTFNLSSCSFLSGMRARLCNTRKTTSGFKQCFWRLKQPFLPIIWKAHKGLKTGVLDMWNLVGIYSQRAAPTKLHPIMNPTSTVFKLPALGEAYLLRAPNPLQLCTPKRR